MKNTSICTFAVLISTNEGAKTSPMFELGLMVAPKERFKDLKFGYLELILVDEADAVLW